MFCDVIIHRLFFIEIEIPASLRVQSLDRRQMRRDPVMIDFEHEPPTKTPVICNKYAMDDVEEREMGSKRSPNARSQSMPRQIRYGDRLLPPGQSDRLPIYEDNDLEMQPIRKGRKPRERQGMFCPTFVCSIFMVFSDTFSLPKKLYVDTQFEF